MRSLRDRADLVEAFGTQAGKALREYVAFTHAIVETLVTGFTGQCFL
ncbi:MAG: hypothetical protein SFZ03_06320 [Candidatus Melainabacteria bacterium]|nr:hypothetical protein [Candidatus Melainabacteria bacterium]